MEKGGGKYIELTASGQDLFAQVLCDSSSATGSARPADPAPVIYTLMEDFFIAERFRTDGVVTVVDSTHILKQLGNHPEPVKQVAMADRLLISKCDLGQQGPTDRNFTSQNFIKRLQRFTS